MGYNTSSAALAYDMNAMPAYRETPQAPVAPREQRAPRFDVYTGAGRQANQAVSPVFMSVLKTFCIIAAIFMTIGVARVALAGVTAQVLNSNAELTSTLEKATDESSDLEGHAFGLWRRHAHSRPCGRLWHGGAQRERYT